MRKTALQWHAGDSKKFLVLLFFARARRFKPGLCLNYLLLLQSPAWFEINLNHLGAGAFEITSRMFLFERVGAAMPKTIFDLGFFMADVRP
jgi:hypothetical protein